MKDLKQTNVLGHHFSCLDIPPDCNEKMREVRNKQSGSQQYELKYSKSQLSQLKYV